MTTATARSRRPFESGFPIPSGLHPLVSSRSLEFGQGRFGEHGASGPPTATRGIEFPPLIHTIYVIIFQVAHNGPQAKNRLPKAPAFSAFAFARQAAPPRRRLSCETAVSMPSPSKSAAHDVPRVACPERAPRGEKLIRTGPLWVRKAKPCLALRLSLMAHPYSADRHHVVGVGAADEISPRAHDRPPALQKGCAVIGLACCIADSMRKTMLCNFKLGMEDLSRPSSKTCSAAMDIRECCHAILFASVGGGKSASLQLSIANEVVRFW